MSRNEVIFLFEKKMGEWAPKMDGENNEQKAY